MFSNRFKTPIFLTVIFVVLCSHDLYIKLDGYFLEPNQEAILSLYNGTFENSENVITRDRMIDASVVAFGERMAIEAEQWQDQDSTITQLPFKTGEEGTYVVGVSTRARNIELAADKFNDYLKHDGVLDMLEQRTKDSLLDQDAVESYQKHVKAIYQVGETKTDDWKTVLGYPIEFVPLSNPYDKYTGDNLEVQLLLDGDPLANQLVYANYLRVEHDHDHGDHSHDDHSHDHEGHDDHSHDKNSHDHLDHSNHDYDHSHEGHSHDHGDHSHDHDGEGHSHDHDDEGHSHDHNHDGEQHSHEHNHDDGKHDHDHESDTDKGHSHTNGQQLKTNDQGVVSVKFPEDGIYYLRTIHMVNVTDNNELTHQSKWATLTFEVTHEHDNTTQTHDHHDHEAEIPTWGFVLFSLIFIVVLFLVFRK